VFRHGRQLFPELDLVLAAVRDANRAAGDLQATTMGPLTQGLGGGLPGGLPGLPGF